MQTGLRRWKAAGLALAIAGCGTATDGVDLSIDAGLGGGSGEDSGGATNTSAGGGRGGAGGGANGGGGVSGGASGQTATPSGGSSAGTDAGMEPNLPPGGCETARDCPDLDTYPEGCAEAECDDGECSYIARDADADGFRAERCRSQLAGISVATETDCNDGDDSVNPNGWDGPEGDDFEDGCNDGVDQDCNGTIDDGQLASGATCVCSPGGTEACSTEPTGIPIDYPLLDEDDEPVGECELGSRECLPNGTWGPCTDAVKPIEEFCNGLDDDCDGDEDEGALDYSHYFCDGDSDEHLLPTASGTEACQPPVAGCDDGTWRENPAQSLFDDCDDEDPNRTPGRDEVCDSLDNDCNEIPDDDATDELVWSYDADGDLYRDQIYPVLQQCDGPEAAPEGCVGDCPDDAWVGQAGPLGISDCNDDEPAINPSATDPCNGTDYDCDGTPLTGCACSSEETMACGTHPGQDGFGPCQAGETSCVGGEWTGCVGSVGPSAEQCGNGDLDCDDTPGNSDPDATNELTWNCDADLDGHLAASPASESSCTTPTSPCAGAWTSASLPRNDCDDGDSQRYLGLSETCDNKDNDCDGLIDDDAFNQENGLKTAYYCDADSDGRLAGGALAVLGCSPPVAGCAGAWRTNPSPSLFDDCDDADEAVNGAEDEVCDGKDNNCDDDVDVDAIDESDWYIDLDEDDYGDENATPLSACSQPPAPIGSGTYVENDATDCDDQDPTSFPNAAERCDGEDNDCSGTADDNNAEDACSLTTNVSSAMCAASACAVDTCVGTFADCTGGWGNGCETDTSDTLAHCGECGTSCSLACVSSDCDEIASLGGGALFTCARSTSGRGLCWGGNLQGQLGDTTETQRNMPTEVAALDAVQSLDVGRNHSCAIQLESPGVTEAYCWGSNLYAQLGTDSVAAGMATSFSDTPVQVEGLTNPVLVSAGEQHSCAVHAGGNVSCWGRNHQGQLGDGTQNDAIFSTTVLKGAQTAGTGLFLQFAIDVSIGAAHSCAIVGDDANDTSGRIVCWGRNSLGQLGDGVTHAEGTCGNCAIAPAFVSTVTDAVKLSAGSDADHTCAIRATGGVACWGDNAQGQLGNNSTTTAVTPVAVSGITSATAIEAGEFHTCAISSGLVACWGQNQYSQLGDGVTHSAACGNCALVPQTLTSLGTVTAIGVGARHTCAVTAQGSQAYCWGEASSGRLGNGTTDAHPTPFPVSPEP